MISRRDPRIVFLIKALVSLIFIAKISLGSVLPIPSDVSIFIFQKGLHPYMNILLCFILGVPLVLMWLRVRERNHLSGYYKLFVFFLTVVMAIQTILQTRYVNQDESTIMQIGALGAAFLMVFIYGLVIPSLWSVKDFVIYIQRWSGAIVVISLLLLPVASGAEFKGGRFIGVFKHIPHMVTCATVAYIFSLITFIGEPKMKHKIWSALVLLASFLTIVLTGTRSAAAAVVVAFVLTMILHKTATTQGRFFKMAVICFIMMFTVFFGYQSYEFAHDIATGETSLGSRGAQDGVAERLEEIERGKQIFLEQPWLGHGLLSKFSSGNEVDVSNYNSMKDPHNILLSAGVVGGWPLLSLAVISLLFMGIGSLRSLWSQNFFKRQVGIYLLAHIPILVIYHIHLSIGGMADRLYWMVFGFVAVAAFGFTEPSANSEI
jgi:hypothetical protein